MKKAIAVIFGGRSAEHDISIITAHTPIISALETLGQYDIWPIYIAQDGKWYADQAMNDIKFFTNPNFEANLAKLKPVSISLNQGLSLSWPGLVTKTVNIDIAFPAMHGTYGEDGSLMGLLRLANIPFVGCDLFASAIAMDKVLTKQIVMAEHIATPPFVWSTKADWLKEPTTLVNQSKTLKWPLFVKPVHLGSSIAIAKVKTEQELQNALEVAFHYDDKVLVEESVENLTEVTLPIIGNEDLELGGVEQPLNKTEFFNFEDKYLGHGKTSQGANTQYSQIPAQISEELLTQVQEVGKKVYYALGCSGIARIDFLIDNATSTVYVNEVNTLPGSLYHHNWRQMGVSGVDLITKLLNFALERHLNQQNLVHTFKSSILSQQGGSKLN